MFVTHSIPYEAEENSQIPLRPIEKLNTKTNKVNYAKLWTIIYILFRYRKN